MEHLEGFLMEDVPESMSSPVGLDLGDLLASSLDDGWWDFQLSEIDPFDFRQNEESNEPLMHDSLQGCNAVSSEQNPYLQKHPFNHEEQQGVNESRVQEELLLEEEEVDNFNDEEYEVDRDDRKSSGSSSKNLVSERNRRKRLNQQLFTLRSLVPNITKMDKRSILVDALAFLQGILQQTEAEIKMFYCDSDFTGEGSEPVIEDEPPLLQPQECIRPAIPTITQVDAEVAAEELFILKITSNKAIGALGQVQKVIESLGLEINLVSVSELDQDYSLITAFLRAKKKGVVTVEKLKRRVKIMAKKMSFHLLGL